MKLHEIPGKVISTWEADVKSVLDTWSNYSISLEEFQEMFVGKSLEYAKHNGGIAFIIDSSFAKGQLAPEIQDYIARTAYQKLLNNGIKNFITIKPMVPGLTNLTVKNYSANAGPAGIQLIEVSSVEDAKLWLKENEGVG